MRTKSRGSRKKLSVMITREKFFELWEQHKKRYGGWFCAYTGQPMTRLRSLNKLKNFKRFELYTSNEATSQQAEYIRDGLSYIEWYKNMPPSKPPKIRPSKEELVQRFRLMPPQDCQNQYLLDFIAEKSVRETDG